MDELFTITEATMVGLVLFSALWIFLFNYRQDHKEKYQGNKLLIVFDLVINLGMSATGYILITLVFTNIPQLAPYESYRYPVGYLFGNAHRIITEKEFLAESDDDRQIQITLSPWILLSADKDVLVPRHQVVTIVEPIDSLKEMYMEKINGSESTSTDK